MRLDTASLGRYPFTPVSLEEMELLPEPEYKGPRIGLLPGISAFVGADIAAGLLACGFGERREKAAGCLSIWEPTEKWRLRKRASDLHSDSRRSGL